MLQYYICFVQFCGNLKNAPWMKKLNVLLDISPYVFNRVCLSLISSSSLWITCYILAVASAISTFFSLQFVRLRAFPGRADLNVVLCTYMHASLETTSRKRKKKKKRLSFHSSIFIFRGCMLMRDDKVREWEMASRKKKWKRSEEGRESEGGMKEGEQDGQGGVCLLRGGSGEWSKETLRDVRTGENEGM